MVVYAILSKVNLLQKQVQLISLVLSHQILQLVSQVLIRVHVVLLLLFQAVSHGL